jgi:hypothetical protein
MLRVIDAAPQNFGICRFQRKAVEGMHVASDVVNASRKLGLQMRK